MTLRSLLVAGLCTLIAGAPVHAKTIQEIQATLSSCKAVKANAEHHLAQITATPKKYKNLRLTKQMLNATVADADKCIEKHQPTMNKHFAEEKAADEAKEKARIAKEERLVFEGQERKRLAAEALEQQRLAQASKRHPYRGIYTATGIAVLTMGATLAAPLVIGAAGVLSAGGVWSLGVGLAVTMISGAVSDYYAYKDAQPEPQKGDSDGE
jgi:hypothetical protein